MSMKKAIAPSFLLLIILLACKKPGISKPLPSMPVADTSNSDTTNNGDTVVYKTYLALGDSYTIGQSVAENGRFPVQTVSMLNSLNIAFKQPEIIAQTGWTTGSLLNRIDNNSPLQNKYDIVTLLIGVNNQYQGRSQQEYRQEFATLLLRSIQYAGNDTSHVFVLSIPDYSVTPFASGRNTALIAAQIDSFNVINKSISEQYNVKYIDITTDSRQAAVYPSLIANDGLHPSAEQYALWVAKLVPAIRILFQ